MISKEKEVYPVENGEESGNVGAVGDADGGGGGPGGDEEAAPPLSKSGKSLSMKVAGDHLDEHKHKYGAGCICATIAVVLGILFGIILVVSATSSSSDDTFNPTASEIVSGKLASTVTTASIIPSKSSSSRRRHRELMLEAKERWGDTPASKSKSGLTFSSYLFGDKLSKLRGSQQASSVKRNLALSEDPTVASDIADFSADADYMLTTDPIATVYDESASVINLVNQIGCCISQIKIFEVGMNTSCNPGRKPFATLIDDSLCIAEATTFSEWYVRSATGPNGGDGVYDYDLKIVWGGQFQVDVTYQTTISGGAKTEESMNFRTEGGGIGVMEQTKDTTTNDATVLFIEKDEASDEVMQYVYAEYNTGTDLGKAISATYYDDPLEYDLDIGTSNYLKRKDNDGTETTTCTEFTEDAQLLVDDKYALFSAMDGSKRAHQSGFPIDLEDDDFPSPLTAFVDFWGLHVSPYFDYESETQYGQSQVEPYFADGVTVKKTVSTDGAEYTLKKSQAKLQRITKQTVSFDDIVNLPLTIQDWSGTFDGTKIRWNGTHVEKVGEKEYRCFQSSNDGPPSEVSTAFDVEGYEDCMCLDTNADPATRRTTGEHSYDYFAFQKDVVSGSASQGTELDITSDTFPRGIEVSSGSIYGRIVLDYEVEQKLYFGKGGTFSEGDTVVQTTPSGTTATGTVLEDTKERIYGLDDSLCDNDDGCYRLVIQSYGDCTDGYDPNAGAGDGWEAMTGYLYEGMTITQGSLSATVAADASLWDGIPIKDKSSNANFVTSADISVSMPAGGLPKHPWIADIDTTQNTASDFKFFTTNTLREWGAVTVETHAASCTGFVEDVDIDGTTDDNGGAPATFSMYITADRTYAWQTYSGTDCDQSTVEVTTANMKSAVDGELGENACTEYPVISFKCKNRIEAVESSVVVVLDDSSPEFERETGNWWDGSLGTEAIVKDSGGATIFSQSPHWVWKEVGDVKAVTGSTTFQYQLRDVMTTADTISGNLACYDRCPRIDADFSDCENNGDCTYDQPTLVGEIRVEDSGNGCTSTTITGVTFENAGDLNGNDVASLVFEWDEEDNGDDNIANNWYLSSVSLASGYTGAGCSADSESAATLTLSSDTCTDDPTVTVECWQGEDAALTSGATDVSSQQSTKYQFDAPSGYLEDTTSGINYRQNTFPSDGQHYGIFFEDVADNYNLLKCDWDTTKICHWKGYDSLTTFYEYTTGGDWNNRITLLDSDGSPVAVSKPAVMTYEHSGSTSNSGRDYSGSMFLLEYRGNEGIDGLPSYCIDASTGAEAECDPWAPFSLLDINIPEDATITSVEGSTNDYLYYAKPSAVVEYYPTTATSDCTNAGLTIPSGERVLTLPDMDSKFVSPPAFTMPSDSELQSSFALGGTPLSVGGVPLFELEGTDGECVAA